MFGTTARLALTAFLNYQLERKLSRLGLSLSLDRRLSDEPSSGPNDIAIFRRAGGFQLGLPASPVDLVFHQRDAIATYLYLFSHSPPEAASMTGVCDDGHLPSAARFAPSTRSARAIALPDRYFVLRDGFAAERRLAEKNVVPWTQRRSALVWRGGVNGQGIHPETAADVDNPRVIQRLRLCMRAATIPGMDIRVCSPMGPHMPLALLRPFGIVGAARPESDWLGDKFALDLDGWTNSWSNLIVRMHFGCCVLKVGSADGFRQWWYDRLVPWEHFVPVAADMSDLAERYDWVLSNDREAHAIAQRGQALVRSMTLASETAIGAQLIARHWKEDSPPAVPAMRLSA
jgi:hypothetical protein